MGFVFIRVFLNPLIVELKNSTCNPRDIEGVLSALLTGLSNASALGGEGIKPFLSIETR